MKFTGKCRLFSRVGHTHILKVLRVASRGMGEREGASGAAPPDGGVERGGKVGGKLSAINRIIIFCAQNFPSY
jgi:hypothetical protein